MKITAEEWAQVIAVMNSAPLQNMQHAVQVSGLVSKVQDHATDLAKLDAAASKDTDED